MKLTPDEIILISDAYPGISQMIRNSTVYLKDGRVGVVKEFNVLDGLVRVSIRTGRAGIYSEPISYLFGEGGVGYIVLDEECAIIAERILKNIMEIDVGASNSYNHSKNDGEKEASDSFVERINTHAGDDYAEYARMMEHESASNFPSYKKKQKKKDYQLLNELKIDCFYHITHIRNLQGILEHGILSHNHAHVELYPIDISDPEVNEARRKHMSDTLFSLPLHDYAPTYINHKNPMLYKRRNLPLAILCISRDIIYLKDTVFTDGNAASRYSNFFYEVEDLRSLDWECLNAEFWNDLPDCKRKRCSEVLVKELIPENLITRVILKYKPPHMSFHTTIPISFNPNAFF